MKSTKRSLFTSALALFLCFSMLSGTTFAWFTDTVTSGNNKIVSGSLKVDLELFDKETGTWESIKNSKKAIFDHKNWEPGYTDVKVLRITNKGSLALKWDATIIPLDELTALADVIDVYVYSGKTAPNARPGRNDLEAEGYHKVGTLREFAEGLDTESASALLAGESDYLGIALKMRESAGNEYKNTSCGEFDIRIVATQYSAESEKDSFDENYDNEAQFPIFKPADVNLSVQTANGFVTADAYKKTGSASMKALAGTKVTDDRLSLNVSEMAASGSNVQLEENEAILPLDVHVDGVAADNTKPIIITLDEAMMTGLNIGNYKLYHVEDGVANLMTAVSSLDELDAHNEFYYDPATGNVSLAMATFSEVAMVAEPPKWEGNRDYSWYTNAVSPLAEGEPDYVIANADQLAAFSAIVGGMDGQTQNSFAGKTVKLTSDINLGDKESENNPNIIFYPIGYYNSEGTYERTNTAITSGLRNFEGTFDGNGHTVSNFYHNTWEMKGDHNWYSPEEQYYRDGMGLFGRVYKGTVKNLTVKNFSSDGEIATTGVIAAYADGATFENIAIFNCNPRVYNIGNGGIVGCVGWYAKEAGLKTTFTNITVDNSNKISALWGSYDVACGGIVGQYYPTSGQSSADYPVNAGIDFVNCHISAQMDVYNDVCANYQYYAYRYTGMLIGSVRENETIDGHVYPKMDGITASGCTVHFGTWNDYYYCEIIDNTTASYTHDYQMSRLTEIKAINGTTITYLDGTIGTVPASGRANYVIVDYTKGHGTDNATCYHFKDGAVWTHDKAGYHDGQNGEKYIDENGDGEADLKEDKQHIYLEFNNLVTGYGWGVTSKGLTDFEGAIVLDTVYEGKLVDKFEKNDALDGDFLYRVGNGNAFPIGKLFQSIGTYPIINSGVHVSVKSLVDGVTMVGTFENNKDDWMQSTLHITGGTGPAVLTIQDYNNCKPFELIVEVVDAVNVTTATSATSNNVVLLQDCGFSSLEVSGGYALYGNGFTMTCGSDSAALDMGYAFVTLNNGTLDNVQIVCPTFDYAVLYKSNMTESGNRSETTDKTRYFNVKSGVMVSGNSQILNSRISGARAAVNVTGGNCIIDNSRLELGAVASLLVGSANSVTLCDVTLVQKPAASTYDPSKTLMGFSVLMICDANGDAAPLTLEGTLVQNAWVDENDKQYVPSAGQSIISTVLAKTEYLHDLDGDGKKESLNLGFAYMPESLTSKVNTTTITDNRTNKDAIPYDYAEVSILNGSTYVYSYKNTNGTADSFKEEAEYVPNKYSDIITVSYSDTSDGLTTGKSYGTDGWVYELNVDLDKLSGYALDFSKVYMSVNGVAVADFLVNGSAKPTTPVAVVAGGVTYTLTATVNGKECKAYLKVTGTETSKESPSKISGPTAAGFGVAKSYGGDWSGAADVLTGVKIKYWSVAENKYIEYDFSNFTVPGNAGKLNGTNNYWEYTHTNNDFTLKVTNNVAIHSGKSVYGMPIRGTDGKLYFTISSTNGYVGSGTTSRAITMQYEFTDNNGGEKLTFSHTYNISYDKDNQYSYSDLSGSGKLTKLSSNSSGDGGCVTGDTLITLADGTQKRADEITYSDTLLVWNFFKGEYTTASPSAIYNYGDQIYKVTNLKFSDGTVVKMIAEHEFFDVEENSFVYMCEDNIEEFIGHKFLKMDNGQYKEVTLISYEFTEEYTGSYVILTAEHYNCFTEGMFSMTADPSYKCENFFRIFEVGENMKFDEAKMQADIEMYGLYTYEDYAAYVTYEEYIAFGGAYFKILVGKGLLEFEDILLAVATYAPNH